MTETTPERLAYSVPEAAALLGVSSDTVYEMIRQRRIPSVRLGRRILIPRPALVRWLESAAEGVAPATPGDGDYGLAFIFPKAVGPAKAERR